MGDERPLDKVPALDVLIRAQIACGRLDEAASAVETLTDVAMIVATPALRARANLSAGLLAAVTGDTRARSLLEDAIDGFDRCRARFDAARARIELAEVMRSLGRAADARREARAAHACLRELGAVADTERARRLLERCDSHGGGPPVPISRREKDVLRLLSEGLTNREISERLFISEHTVHRHVTNVLRKLDVPSRAAAAAYAVRAGLAGRPRE